LKGGLERQAQMLKKLGTPKRAELIQQKDLKQKEMKDKIDGRL